MKSFAFKSSILVAIAMVSLSAFAASPTAKSTSVTLIAQVPEYIGLDAVNVAPVTFNFKGIPERISNGETNLGAPTMQVPKWTLSFNLKHRDITVCAYATDLLGTDPKMEAGEKIPAAFLSGQSLQMGSPNAWFGYGEAKCSNLPGAQPSAMLLDVIKNATSSTNNGGPVSEGFYSLDLNLNPGNHNFGSTGAVPAPDKYVGHLYIVAQAI